jgi:hypothetical protein
MVVGALLGWMLTGQYLDDEHKEDRNKLKRLATMVTKAQDERREMLILLSKVYQDIDRTNGSLYWDTVRDVKKWVNNDDGLETE